MTTPTLKQLEDSADRLMDRWEPPEKRELLMLIHGIIKHLVESQRSEPMPDTTIEGALREAMRQAKDELK